MVFDINYILKLKENYNRIDLPNDFLLFNKEYIYFELNHESNAFFSMKKDNH